MTTQYEVTKYNDPTHAKPQGLAEAVGAAGSPFEANALAYKLTASAELLKQSVIAKESKLTYGELVDFGDTKMRVDLSAEDANGVATVARFLANGERLAKEEPQFFEAVLANPSVERMLVVHEASLHPSDEQALQDLSGKHGKLMLKQVRLP